MLEYVPDTVYRINKHYTKNEQRMPLILVKLYTYQVGGWVVLVAGQRRCSGACCCAPRMLPHRSLHDMAVVEETRTKVAWAGRKSGWWTVALAHALLRYLT